MDELVTRSGKMSKFEFWLECKAKAFAGGCQQKFCFWFNIKLIQSKAWIFSVFSVAQKFKLTDLDIKLNIFSKIFRTLTELAKGPEFGTFCKSKLMTNTILTNCHFNKLAWVQFGWSWRAMIKNCLYLYLISFLLP